MRIVCNEHTGNYDVFFKYKDSFGQWRSSCKRSLATKDAAKQYATEYVAAKKDGKAHAHRS